MAVEYIKRSTVLSHYRVDKENIHVVDCDVIANLPAADVIPKSQYERDRKEWMHRYIEQHDAYIELVKDFHDYKPVIHGHWIGLDGYMQCSACKDLNLASYTFKYCPKCGARMDENEHTD